MEGWKAEILSTEKFVRYVTHNLHTMTLVYANNTSYTLYSKITYLILFNTHRLQKHFQFNAI